MGDNRPVQHTPKHLQGDNDVFDRRHPAASAFAPAQPGAGVVADDVEEAGQNLAGGEKASDAEGTFSDQKEVLEKQHEDSLRKAVVEPVRVDVEGDHTKKATATKTTAPAKTAAKKTAAKTAAKQ